MVFKLNGLDNKGNECSVLISNVGCPCDISQYMELMYKGEKCFDFTRRLFLRDRTRSLLVMLTRQDYGQPFSTMHPDRLAYHRICWEEIVIDSVL